MIILITRWEINIFLLILLITAIASIITLMNAEAQPTKTQKQESKAHWRFLVNWQISSCSLFTASTLLCCIVCAGVCVPVIMQNGSVNSYSADSGAMRSKRNCEAVKGSRALQEEVLSLFFFYFYSACRRGAATQRLDAICVITSAGLIMQNKKGLISKWS